MIEVRKSRDRRAGPRRGLLGVASTLAMVGTSLVFAQPAWAADITSLTVTSTPGQRSLSILAHPLAADASAATSGFHHITVSAMVGSATITTCTISLADATGGTPCTLTPLVAGTSYKIVAKAMSAANETSLVTTGTIEASAGSTTTPKLTPPGNGTVMATATGASGDVKVEWTPDPNVGGSVVDHFTVKAYLGASTVQGTCVTADAATDNCTVHGLVNGATYSFTVVANSANSVADSPATNGAATATPGVGAGAVTNVVATTDEGNNTAVVSWTAPTNADVDTSYEFALTELDGTAVSHSEECGIEAGNTTETGTVTTPWTSCDTIQSATPYRIKVRSVKNGVVSAWVTADFNPTALTPTVPEPRTATVTGGDKEATVSWLAPTPNGVTVSGYRVIAMHGTDVAAACATTTELTCKLTGLTNGLTYTPRVYAYGTGGTTSAAGAAVVNTVGGAATVTPAVVPKPSAPTVTAPAPADITATAAVITWTPATVVQGAPVAYYTATATVHTSSSSAASAASDSSDAAAAAAAPSCTAVAPAVTCTINGLQAGTQYDVKVVAYASATAFSPAGTVTITTTASAVPGGGGTMTGPIVANRDGKSQMFARGGDNYLYTSVRDSSGNWGTWTSLGGVISGDPVAVLTGTGATARLVVFVLGGADHAVWYRAQDATGTGFGPWTHVDGTKWVSQVHVVKNNAGTVQVFGKSSDGLLYYSVQSSAADPTTWQGWVSLGGVIASEPNVVQWDDGTLEVFALGGGDGMVWHTKQSHAGDNTSWIWWSHVSPTAAQNVSL